jgi:hypothetical protein
MKRITVSMLFAILASGSAVYWAGCEREGPAERAGEEIDRAAEGVKDKLDPAGPGEKAGEKLDRAVEEVTK